jgi:subtilisin family serine protease
VGHGSHTASTVAGRPVGNVSFDGLAAGVARGAVPGARLAVYKVCWEGGGCGGADILAAFDDAIADGVDVISFSIGGSLPSPYFRDAAAIGSFHAVRRGVVTSTSAGNSGLPGGGRVCNVAPWMLSVAASSIDRRFTDTIVLGNGETFVVRAGTKLLSVLLPIFLHRNTNICLKKRIQIYPITRGNHYIVHLLQGASIDTFPTLTNATLAFPTNG